MMLYGRLTVSCLVVVLSFCRADTITDTTKRYGMEMAQRFEYLL